MENWKPMPIAGLEAYEVSDLGRVRRFATSARSGGRILKGNPTVSLFVGEKKRSFRVARLVALAFVTGDSSLSVSFVDGNGLNCAASNLRWSTAAEINERARSSGRWQPLLHARGRRRLTDVQVREIRRRGAQDHSTAALAAMAEIFGVRPTTIHAAIFGRTWKHLPVSPPALLRRGGGATVFSLGKVRRGRGEIPHPENSDLRRSTP